MALLCQSIGLAGALVPTASFAQNAETQLEQDAGGLAIPAHWFPRLIRPRCGIPCVRQKPPNPPMQTTRT